MNKIRKCYCLLRPDVQSEYLKDAITKYVGDVYIQHNPAVGDGKEAFIEYFERMSKEYHDKHVYFKHYILKKLYGFALLSSVAG